MIRNSILAACAACTVVFVLGEKQAAAQHPQPFLIIGAGVGPEGLPLPGEPPRPHSAVGLATHFGAYHGEGTLQTDSATFLPNGEITGEFGSASPFIFTASNGDQLATYYGRTDFGAENPGSFTLYPQSNGMYIAVFLAEFVPYAPLCTGEFRGISGSWTMLAITEPFELGSSAPLAYEWQGEGSLTFEKEY